MQRWRAMPAGAEYRLPGLSLRLSQTGDSTGFDAEATLATLLDRQQAELGDAALMGWRGLPSETHSIEQIQQAARLLAAGSSELLLIGMGGSINGARAVYRALELDSRLMRAVEFMDNPDPATMITVLESVDPASCSVLAVSRSGNTLETVAMLAASLQFLDAGDAGGPQVAVCCLDNDNPLGTLADRHGWERIALPAHTGGRFSMFTAAGLLPLAFAGLDIAALSKAAAETATLLEGTALADNPAWQLSGLLLADGIANAVLYCYGDLLLGFGDWWRQLIAESTGRTLPDGKRIGVNPLVARGASDQHSLNQLFLDGPANNAYCFLSCNEPQFDMSVNRGSERLPAGFEHIAGQSMHALLEASRRGTLATLESAGCPVAELELDRLDEQALGSLLQLWMHTTACLGIRLGINPYDQPGVERSKQVTDRLLRDGQ
ncbi:hypothetical protein KDL29_10070 [bacterium]|nr:hypothetical protein [bacterium]